MRRFLTACLFLSTVPYICADGGNKTPAGFAPAAGGGMITLPQGGAGKSGLPQGFVPPDGGNKTPAGFAPAAGRGMMTLPQGGAGKESVFYNPGFAPTKSARYTPPHTIDTLSPAQVGFGMADLLLSAGSMATLEDFESSGFDIRSDLPRVLPSRLISVYNSADDSLASSPSLTMLRDMPGSNGDLSSTGLALSPVDVRISSMDPIKRGVYFLNFRYTVHGNVKYKGPLVFKALVLSATGSPAACYCPYVHNSGPCHNRQAGIPITFIAQSLPVSFDGDGALIQVYDGNDHMVGQFRKEFSIKYFKRFRDITSSDIASHLNMNQRSWITLSDIADEGRLFRAEPAMLFLKTNRGGYVKALVRTVGSRGGSSGEFLEIIEAVCFEPKPGGGKDKYRQLFGSGGYILPGQSLDFDREGTNCNDRQRDVYLDRQYINNSYITVLRCADSSFLYF